MSVILFNFENGSVPPATILFGQYLLDRKKIDFNTLRSALLIQTKEKEQRLRESCRLLGHILLEEFNVFKNRVELMKYLQEFIIYKAEIEMALIQMKDLKK